MDGLYNAIFEMEEHAELLCKALGIGVQGSPYIAYRLRDAWLNPDGTVIIVALRNGSKSPMFSQVIMDIYRAHTQYMADYDDSFDRTYCYIEFRVPEEFTEDFKKIAPHKQIPNISEKFKQLFEDQQNNVDNEYTRRGKQVMEKVGKQIQDALKTKKGSHIINVGKKHGDAPKQN